MQPYYIHATKNGTTKHPSERHAYNTNKACQIARTPLTQLTWKLHTKSIIEKIQKTKRQMHWLTSRKSKLSIEDKLKIYKTIIKPIWTYGIPLWGTAAMSHINKIEIVEVIRCIKRENARIKCKVQNICRIEVGIMVRGV